MSMSLAWMLSALAAGPAHRGAELLVWSDLHGAPSPKLFAWVDSLRRQARAEQTPVLALDAGDALFGSDLSHATAGEGMVRILNSAKPDAMVLGAGDFRWTRQRLDTLLSRLTVPVLSSNLRNDLDDAPYGGGACKVWDFDGLKIAVVGVVESDIAFSDRPSRTQDLRSEEPQSRVKDLVDSLRQKAGARIVVALSHAGARADEELARAVPDLDLVVGSADGTLDTTYSVEKVRIVRFAAGPSQVHRVDISVQDAGLDLEARRLPVPGSPIALPASQKAVFDSVERSQKIRSDSIVGSLPEAWPKTAREGSLGNFLADALRAETGAEVGIWPAAGIHAGLPKGKVTAGDLHRVLGSFELVSVFELPGSELKRLVKNQFQRPTDFLFLSGLTCTPDSSRFGGPGTEVLLDGHPVQGGEHYRIAIPQCLRADLYNLTGFSVESAAPEYREMLWDRDAVLQYVRKNGLRTSLGRVPAMYGASR